MAKDLGWIRLYRSSFNNRLYFSEPFTRWQAWCDLLLLANHKSGHFRVRGVMVEILRGQTGFSVVELANRWRWSRGKANRFLDELKNEQQIVQQKSNITTLISIVNYEKYQTDSTAYSTANGTVNGTANEQKVVQQTDINKNDNNEKNDNKPKKEGEIDFKFWKDEKQNFLQAGDWIFKFCRDKGINLEFFDKCSKEYLSDCELREDYKDAKALKNHFTHWFNKYKKNNWSGLKEDPPTSIKKENEIDYDKYLKKKPSGV